MISGEQYLISGSDFFPRFFDGDLVSTSPGGMTDGELVFGETVDGDAVLGDWCAGVINAIDGREVQGPWVNVRRVEEVRPRRPEPERIRRRHFITALVVAFLCALSAASTMKAVPVHKHDLVPPEAEQVA